VRCKLEKLPHVEGEPDYFSDYYCFVEIPHVIKQGLISLRCAADAGLRYTLIYVDYS